jgi:hypothetical protein
VDRWSVVLGENYGTIGRPRRSITVEERVVFVRREEAGTRERLWRTSGFAIPFLKWQLQSRLETKEGRDSLLEWIVDKRKA